VLRTGQHDAAEDPACSWRGKAFGAVGGAGAMHSVRSSVLSGFGLPDVTRPGLLRQSASHFEPAVSLRRGLFPGSHRAWARRSLGWTGCV